MTYIFFLDTLVANSIGFSDIFFSIQIVLALLVFYQSIWQRAHQVSFKTEALQNGLEWWILKAGQLGLYIQMMVCVIAAVDGFQNLIAHTAMVHLFIIGILLGTSLSKINAIANVKKNYLTN